MEIPSLPHGRSDNPLLFGKIVRVDRRCDVLIGEGLIRLAAEIRLEGVRRRQPVGVKLEIPRPEPAGFQGEAKSFLRLDAFRDQVARLILPQPRPHARLRGAD